MSDETNPGGTGGEPTEPVTTPTEPTANVSKPTEPAKGQDHQSAYKGLQRKYDKLFNEHTQLEGQIADLNETIEGLKQQLKAATTERDQIATKNVDATEKIQGLEATVNTSQQTIERQKLIMSEFQDLAQFEAKGLLPQAQTTEEMRTVFESFRETMGSQVTTAVDEKVKGVGASPTEPKEPTPPDADQLYDQMNALAGSTDPKDRAEYEKKFQQWSELHE